MSVALPLDTVPPIADLPPGDSGGSDGQIPVVRVYLTNGDVDIYYNYRTIHDAESDSVTLFKVGSVDFVTYMRRNVVAFSSVMEQGDAVG